MKKIPIFEVNAGGRVQSLLLENFKNIIKFTRPDSSYKIPKAIFFFEYLGFNSYSLDALRVMLGNNNSNSIYLIVDDSYEGLVTETFIKQILEITSEYSCIEKWKIISSNAKLENIMNKYNCKESFLYYNCHLSISKYDGIDVQNTILNNDIKLRQKKYICLNRQERLHRALVIDHLIENNFLNHGFVSCPLGDYELVLNKNAENLSQDPSKVLYYDQNLTEYKFLPEQKNRLLSTLPLELDVANEQHKSMRNEMPDPKIYYNESYISLITEGDFYRGDTRQMFTEKVLKSFIYEHIFIVFGLPGTLELVREHGFLTFPHIINESYDEEQNDDNRLKMALHETDKLLSKNIHEIKDIYEEAKPILEHNRKLALLYNATPSPSLLVNSIQQWFYN